MRRLERSGQSVLYPAVLVNQHYVAFSPPNYIVSCLVHEPSVHESRCNELYTALSWSGRRLRPSLLHSIYFLPSFLPPIHLLLCSIYSIILARHP